MFCGVLFQLGVVRELFGNFYWNISGIWNLYFLFLLHISAVVCLNDLFLLLRDGGGRATDCFAFVGWGLGPELQVELTI
jgi:hypothetical protein